MRMNLRLRIFLAVLPLLILLAVLGAAGAALLYLLGRSIETILRENYRSVIAMHALDKNVEGIDSAFRLALKEQGEKGKPHGKKAKEQYDENWQQYDKNLAAEKNNITLPHEDELVEQ